MAMAKAKAVAKAKATTHYLSVFSVFEVFCVVWGTAMTTKGTYPQLPRTGHSEIQKTWQRL